MINKDLNKELETIKINMSEIIELYKIDMLKAIYGRNIIYNCIDKNSYLAIRANNKNYIIIADEFRDDYDRLSIDLTGQEDGNLIIINNTKFSYHGHRYGKGHGHIIILGNGVGNSKRSGEGHGHAIRLGSGNGRASRFGKGNGHAYRSGSGNGYANRNGNGHGNAIRMESGDGNANRFNKGKGYALKLGPGKGYTRYNEK